MMIHAIRLALAAVSLGSLLTMSGCVSGYKKMTLEQQAAVQSVSIAQSVSVPDFPMVFGPSTNAGAMLLGPLAVAAAASKDNPDGQALKRMFADHEIDLGTIVREEFVGTLKSMGSFPRVDVAQGEATFELTVESYGLGAAGFTPFSPVNHPLKPHMRVSAKLTNRTGELLWQNSGYIASTNEAALEGRTFDEILADPKRTEKEFRAVARLVSGEVLKDLPIKYW